MPSKWRRFEVLIPLQWNDGHWLHDGTVYRDNLSRIIVDVPDTVKNRQWMKKFKARWKRRLEQLEIWLVSYRIEID